MRQRPTLAFILVTVFLDVLGIGLMIPVLPTLIGTMTQSPDQQAYWYGALAASYGVMQFFSHRCWARSVTSTGGDRCCCFPFSVWASATS